MDTTPERFWRRVLVGAPDACWPFMGARGNRSGHGSIGWAGKSRLAHRIAYQLATGVTLPDVPKLRADSVCVLHTCDNPPCCNPAHLRLGTQKDNIRDCAAKGRLLTGDANPSRRMPHRLARGDASGARLHPETRLRGSANPIAKLSEADIPTIRSRRAAGETLSAIADTYGVSLQTIWRIAKGDSWQHVTNPR
jgi:hypothetical protein